MSAQPIYQQRQVTYGIEAFTPAIAKAILDTQNIDNRPIRKSRVEKLASEMRDGKWHSASADAICFDTEGVLINGQHRLAAVVLSGVTVSMPVGRNIPSSAFQIIDRGAKRSSGDDLHRIGIPSYNKVAAMITNYIGATESGTFDPHKMAKTKRGVVSPRVVTEFAEDNREMVSDIGRLSDYIAPLGETRYILATFMHMAVSGVSVLELREFAKLLDPTFNGDVNNQHPSRVASRTLMMAKMNRTSLQFHETAEIIIRAFNDSKLSVARSNRYIPTGNIPSVKVTA